MTEIALIDTTAPTLSDRHRDYLMITIFVLAQNGNYARAKTICDGLLALGETSDRVLQCQAVLEYFNGNYAVTLSCLDHLARAQTADQTPISPDVVRMRQYLRAKCFFAIGDEKKAQEIASSLSAKPKAKPPVPTK